MTSIYEMFETDKSLETDGIWYWVSKTTGFKLARAGGANMKFAKALEAKTRPHRRQIDEGTLDPDLGQQIMVEAFVDTVLLDWKEVKDKKGKALSYSRENALKLLTDLPDLFTELRTEATRLSNFRVAQIEEDAGN